MRYLVSVIFTLLVASLLAPEAFAQVAPQCNNIYNGPGSCSSSPSVSLQKQIQNPETGEFVDILNVDQATISPGSNVTFRITITNIGGLALENINVTDVMPDALENVRPQKGEFNTDNNTLSYYLDSLAPQATETFDIEATVKSADQLPKGSLVCLANLVSLESGPNDVSDNVQFCIGGTQTQSASTGTTNPQATTTPPPSSANQTTKGGKQVASASNATTAPNTGPGLVSVLALLPAAIGGYLLRRQTSK